MLSINREINPQLKWAANWFSVAGIAVDQVPMFRITDTKLYDPMVMLST